MRRGELTGRWDTNFLLNRTDFSQFRYEIIPIENICLDVFQGITIKKTDDVDAPKVLKVKNICLNGSIDFCEIESTTNVPDRKLLKVGDVISPFIGEAIRQHKVALYEDEANKYTVDGNVGVYRPNKKKIKPRFLKAILSSSFVTKQVNQLIGGGGVPFLGARNAKKLKIPLPPLDIQRRLVAELDAARAERDRALAEAERLLASIDDLVKAKLGLFDLEPPKQIGYAIRLATAKNANTLSADFFHPERIQAMRMIQSLDNAPLSQLVSFQRDIVQTPGDSRYVGLASIVSGTGQLTEIVETASGQSFAFEPGDVLYGRLRPYLNKVWLATFSGVCSTEFHVMRPLDTRRLRPEYLAVVMRTDLIVAQTKHMMTGNTHPRIANEDVINLLIPLTDEKTQQSIVEETIASQTESARLRTHAEAVWREARERFEQQLLQGNKS